MQEATKSILIFRGKIPQVFYYAALLPFLITYLEHSLNPADTSITALKHLSFFIFYLFGMKLIQSQRVMIHKNIATLNLRTPLFSIKREIQLCHIKSITPHKYIPRLKIIRIQSKIRNQTIRVFDFFHERESLFEVLKKKSNANF